VTGASEAKGNESYAWQRFDPEAYVAHYYADPHPDDDKVVRLTRAALARAKPGAHVVDVGTGPNLFPLFAAAPNAGRITVWEYSPSNIAWLERVLRRGALTPPWTHFWKVARQGAAVKPAPANPILTLRRRVELVQGSIFDLPARKWDAATMFFCAESITQQQSEFETACAAFARCVRRGGVLAAAFLAGSRGYEVGSEHYPAVAITQSVLRQAFRGRVRRLRIARIGAMGAEIRSGYSGMFFLTAEAV
jgi:hypothetical protein